MKKLLPFFLISIFKISNGQSPLVKQWDHRYGGPLNDFFQVLLQTDDGGFLLCGSSNSNTGGDKTDPNNGPPDYWVVKTDSLGLIQWDGDYGGLSNDWFTAAIKTLDGGYLLGGYSSSGVGGDKTQPSWAPGPDYWVVKIDSSGMKQWDKAFGGTGDDELSCLLQTNDGGYLIGGTSKSGNNGDKTQAGWGSSDYWIIKTDASGNKLWDKTFGGSGADQLFSFYQTLDNGFILGGSSNSNISGIKTQPLWGGYDFWLIKSDSAGNLQWDANIGGLADDYLKCVLQESGGGYVLGGISSSGTGGDKSSPNHDTTLNTFDYWLVKTDAAANVQWERSYGAAGNEDECGNVVKLTDGGYLVTGTSYSQAGGDKSENNLGIEQIWTIKTDSSGNKQWDRTMLTVCIFDDEVGVGLQGTEGAFIFAGYTDADIGGDKSESSRGAYDYWIIKFLDTTWVSNGAWLASSDTIFCGKQCIDFYDMSTNNPSSWQWFFPGGSPSSSVAQNPSGICYNSFGSFDVTLIACNGSACDTFFLPGFINELQNPPVPVVTISADTLYSTAAYAYQWYYNAAAIPGATGQYYVFQQSGNYFVITTDSNGCASASVAVVTGMEELDDQGIVIIPNPSDGNILLSGVKPESVISIFDLTGQLLLEERTVIQQQTLRLDLPDGIYFLGITNSHTVIKRKIIIKN